MGHPLFAGMLNAMPERMREGGGPFLHFVASFKIYCVHDLEELREVISAHYTRASQLARERSEVTKERRLMKRLDNGVSKDLMATFGAPLSIEVTRMK